MHAAENISDCLVLMTVNCDDVICHVVTGHRTLFSDYSDCFSTLAPDAICKACCYQASNGSWVKPAWVDGPSSHSYYPSYNLAPTTFRYVRVFVSCDFYC